MLQLVGRKGSQPCMNGMSILNDRVRKNVLIFSLMVVKASTWNCISSPSAETAAEGRAEGSNSRRNSRCCLCTRTRTKTQCRNRHQLQFQCTGTRQAAHRIAEAASRTGRAGTSTWNCISSPSTEPAAETAAEGTADATADAAHSPEPERNPKQEPAPTAISMRRNKTSST